MKPFFLILLTTLLFTGCKKDEVDINQGIFLAKQACSSDMDWLSELVAKGEEDRTTKKYLGAYMGTIYLTSYKDRPVFVVTMMINSGGVMFHAYYCDHQPVLNLDDPAAFFNQAKEKGKLIYTNW